MAAFGKFGGVVSYRSNLRRNSVNGRLVHVPVIYAQCSIGWTGLGTAIRCAMHQ